MSEDGARNDSPRVPKWLAELGVKEGEYFTDSKLRLKRAMKSRCMNPAARVYACLALHTMAFQQQMAVKMDGGKRVPLAPRDIAAETGLARQNIHRTLMELKSCGLVDVKGSTKGRVEIFAWAVPKLPEDARNCNQNDYNFPGAPRHVRHLLARFRVRLPANFVIGADYLSAVEAALAEYEKARMALCKALIGNQQLPALNKEEINERNLADLASYDDPKDTESLQAARRNAELDQVGIHLEAIQRDCRPELGRPNDQTVKNFWTVTQQYAPTASGPEIGDLIRRILDKNSGLRSWGGVFNEFRKEVEEGAKVRQAPPTDPPNFRQPDWETTDTVRTAPARHSPAMSWEDLGQLPRDDCGEWAKRR